MKWAKSLKIILTSFFLLILPALVMASEEAAHGGEADHGKEMIMTLIFNTINFILFVALLVILLRKPLANFIRERSKNVAADIEESRKLLEDAQKRHVEMKERIDRLDTEIAELRERLREEGEVQGDRIIERSKQAVERIREDAKFQADQQVKMAKEELQAEAARLAVEAAEEMLKKSVNEKDHDQLVGRFLREVKES